MDKVCEIIEKYWLKPVSSIFVAIVLLKYGCLTLFTSIKMIFNSKMHITW